MLLDDLSASCSPFPQDADIGGIGVRITFYIQSFVMVLLIATSFKDASGALWTLIATSIGLQLSAIIQYGSGLLSLFQAVQVSYLVSMACAATFFGLVSYTRGGLRLKHDFRVQEGGVVSIFISLLLGVVLWGGGFKSSDRDECSSVTPFLIVGKSVKAVTTGRTVCLSLVALLLVMYICLAVFELWDFSRHRKEAVLEDDVDMDGEADGGSNGRKKKKRRKKRSMNILVLAFKTPRRWKKGYKDKEDQNGSTNEEGMQLTSPTATRTKANKKHPNSKDNVHGFQISTSNKDIDWALSIAIVVAFVLVAYFLVMNELLVHQGDSDVKRWGFGQVFALIATAPSLVTLFQPSTVPLRQRIKDRFGTKGPDGPGVYADESTED